MKVIIAGSRSVRPAHVQITEALQAEGWQPTIIVSGGARGADRAGEDWAVSNGVLMRKFPADWDKFGKTAGFRRNQEMADYADALLVFWDGESRGTHDMIKRMRTAGKPVRIVYS